jgi:hypothetical protein
MRGSPSWPLFRQRHVSSLIDAILFLPLATIEITAKPAFAGRYLQDAVAGSVQEEVLESRPGEVDFDNVVHAVLEVFLT